MHFTICCLSGVEREAGDDGITAQMSLSCRPRPLVLWVNIFVDLEMLGSFHSDDCLVTMQIILLRCVCFVCDSFFALTDRVSTIRYS